MGARAERPGPQEPRFATVLRVAETGSTNGDLLRWGREGAKTGLVLVADHQRSGRGRQQRVWHDRPGASLLVSALLRPDRDHLTIIPLVAGLAAVDVVDGLRGGSPAAEGSDGRPVALKWPNDVVVPGTGSAGGAGAKLAGILAESAVVADDGRAAPVVVVGLGMNLIRTGQLPDGVEGRAAALAEVLGAHREPPSRDDVLDRFLAAFDRRLATLEQQGPEPVLDVYRKRCATIGCRVRLATADGGITGTATDVTATGALVVTDDDGQSTTVTAGDAHHLPASATGPPAG